MLRVAVDDASVHRARYIDLMGDQLNRYLRGTAGEFGLDDVRAVKPKDSRLEGFLGSDPLVDRGGELLEDFVAQQRPQSRLVARGKCRDDGFERYAGTIEKLRRVKARVGMPYLIQSLGDRIDRRGTGDQRWRRTNRSRRRSFPVRRPRTLRNRSTKNAATIANRMMSKY